MVITGGLHGNEPAGVIAAEEVLRILARKADVLRGRVVAFCGNRVALARGLRYVARDLNRGWQSSELDGLHARAPDAMSEEDREQAELHAEIIALERPERPLLFLDLHTTSGPTEPFLCFADTPDNRAVASALPVNVVLGLERTLHGSLLSWAEARGHGGVSFEAGQHLDPAAARRHSAAIWLFLLACGALDAQQVPDEAEHVAVLTRSSARSKVVEVRHRHVVEEGDDFEMLDGFVGFDPIEAGQIVARDRHGPVRSPETGLMLMPRYQGKGEDGFFVAREVAARTSWATR